MHTMRLFTISISAAAIAGCGPSTDASHTETMAQPYGTGGTMEMAEPAPMEREAYGEREQREMEEDQAFQPTQPMEQQPPRGEPQQLGQQTTPMAEGQLAMRKGEESTPIREVVLIRERGNRANLVFFSRDIDCATVSANPSADADFVMMVPVRADREGTVQQGAVAAGRWTVRGTEAGQTQTMRGQRGWITITSSDDQRVEGDVDVSTTVQREEVELNGPFTATICESPTTTGQPGTTQPGQPQDMQSPQNQNQQTPQNQNRPSPSQHH